MTQKFIAALSDPWVILGFAGQALFMMRFVVQWIASERAKKSVMPNIFWVFSIGGGFVLFVYALHKQDPVFTLGQGLGLIVYIRNMMLIHKHRNAEKVPV